MAILLRANKVLQGSSELLVESGQIIIGRLPSNHLSIPGVEVEPIHAMIEVDPAAGDAKLVDMASEAGLRLNGKVVEVVETLKPGDLIQIGKVRIEVLDPKEAAEDEEEKSLPPPPPGRDELRTTSVVDRPGVDIVLPKNESSSSADASNAPNGAPQQQRIAKTQTMAKPPEPQHEPQRKAPTLAGRSSQQRNKTARVSYGALFQPGKEKSAGSTLEIVAFWDQNIIDVRHYGGVLKKGEDPRPSVVYLGNEEDGHLIGVGPKANVRNYKFANVSTSKTTVYLDADMRARVRKDSNFERIQGPGKFSMSNRDLAIIKHGPVNYFLHNVSLPNPVLRKFEDPDGRPVIFWFAAVLYVLLSLGIYAISKDAKLGEQLDEDPWSQVLTVRTPTPRPTAVPAAKPPVEVPKPKPPPPQPPKKETPPPKVVKPAATPPPPQPRSLQKPRVVEKVPVHNKGVVKGEVKNAHDRALGRKTSSPNSGNSGGAKGGTSGAMAGQRQGNQKSDKMGVEGGKKDVLSGINLDELGTGLGKVMDVNAAGAIATGLKSSAGGAGGGSGSGARGSHGFGGIGSQNSLSTGGPSRALAGLGGGAGGLGSGGLGGSGGGDLGRKIKAQAVAVPEGDPAVEGGLTKEEIEAVIRANLAQIKACYERNLQGNRELAGRVKTNFSISPSGHVTAASIDSSTLGSPATESCIIGAIKRWKFPLPRNNSAVQVRYPFVLSSR